MSSNTAGRKKPFSTSFRLLSILAGCFQNMTTGGILFGWASISGSLLISSVEDGGPGLTREYVHVMFTGELASFVLFHLIFANVIFLLPLLCNAVASFFNFIGPLLLGIILDMFGPRICSMISISCIALGSTLFAVSSTDGAPLFLPAMCLIAFGGPGAQNAIIHLSNLFPTKKATVTAIITGSFQISFFIFFCFDYLWANKNYDYQTLFMGYSSVLVLNVLLSFLLWPDKPYNFDDELLSVASMNMQSIRAPRHQSTRGAN